MASSDKEVAPGVGVAAADLGLDSSDSEEEELEEKKKSKSSSDAAMASRIAKAASSLGGKGKGKVAAGTAALLDDLASDEDDDDSDEDDDDEGGAGGGGDDDDDDDDDEDDEEEEEEEDAPVAGSSKRKASASKSKSDKKKDKEAERAKKKRRRIESFLQVEADVDDDEEEDDEDEDDELIAREADEADAAAADAPRMHAALRQQNAFGDEGMNNEELERFVRERYQRQDVTEYQETGPLNATEQQGLLPSVNDPKLWMVKCKPGKEREVIFQLMQKCVDFASRGTPLMIYSVTSRDELKGHIYVEAMKESHVRDATRGFHFIYQSKVRLVPIDEMVEVVTVVRRASESIRPGQWVRMRTGAYKDDLARVAEIDEAVGQITVQLVPRLDYTAIAAKAQSGGHAPKKQAAMRPAQRPFKREEAEAATGLVVEGGSVDETLHFNGMKFRRGYLLKTCNMSSVLSEKVQPLFDELQTFNQCGLTSGAGDDETFDDGTGRGGGGGGDLQQDELAIAAAAGAVEASKAPDFRKGDAVVVVDGDLKTLTGVVHGYAEDGNVLVMPNHEELKELLPFEARQLEKQFNLGDSVRITRGPHTGAVCLILAVEDNRVASVWSDASKEEYRVFTRDLVEASGAAATAGMASSAAFHGYKLHDFVMVDAQTAGVVIQIDAETCRVLTNGGTPNEPDVRDFRFADLAGQRKNSTRGLSAMDQHMTPVRADDIVRIAEGAMTGKSGTVLHVHKGFFWILCRDRVEHAGVICVRSRSCVAQGTKSSAVATGGNPFGAAHGGMGGMPSRSQMLASPGPNSRFGGVLQSPGRPGMQFPSSTPPMGYGSGATPQMGGMRPGGGGGFSARRDLGRRDDSLIGTRTKIRSGAFRGYRGKVVDATDSIVRIELEALCRTVTVKREDVEGAQMMPTMAQPMQHNPGYGGGFQYPPRTPAYGGMPQTPAYGGFGGMPQTPGHAPFTPARDHDAWNIATPAHIPAWQQAEPERDMHSAPTPGGHAAPTPNIASYTPHASTPGLAAPTPGDDGYGGSVATPGGGYTPNLPGFTPAPGTVAATPGVGGAMTPGMAAGGGSDGVAVIPGLLVKLPSGGEGIVLSVEGASCTAMPDGGGASVSIPTEDVAPVTPVKHDRLLVIRGEFRNMKGKLVGVADESDGIVKLDDNPEIKIVELANLGKIRED